MSPVLIFRLWLKDHSFKHQIRWISVTETIQIRNSLVGKPGHILMYYIVYYKQRIAGEIKSFSTEGWVAGKFARRMDKFMLYLLTAGKKAVLDAGITEDEMKNLDKAKCGVLIGSAMGGMQVCGVLLELLYVSCIDSTHGAILLNKDLCLCILNLFSTTCFCQLPSGMQLCQALTQCDCF